MKKLVLCLAIGIIWVGIQTSGAESKLSKAPMNPDFINGIGSPYGYMPPPIDFSYLKAAPSRRGLLAAYDSRTAVPSFATPIDNQNPYGACWAFSATGDFESKVAHYDSTVLDLSESQLIGCNKWGADCDSGGNSMIAASVWTVAASQLESCNAYPPTNCTSPSCNTTCPGQQYVTEWQILPLGDVSIKTAVYNEGPVQVGIDANVFPVGYNGTCIISGASATTNHAVLIVGWDDMMDSAMSICSTKSSKPDTKTTSTGAWIVKNSWGTGWGDSGYFYVAYGSANIGDFPTVTTDYKDYIHEEKILYYDEIGGITGAVGCGATTAYAAVTYTPPYDGDITITHVDFWAHATNTAYEIRIYDNFNGTNFTSQLGTTVTGTVPNAGYYSIPLSGAIPVIGGNAFTVWIKLTTPGYNLPIPITWDWEPTVESGKCFVSCDGTAWEDVGSGTALETDVGVRARIMLFDPSIGLSTPQLTFKATEGAANPAAQSLVIANPGPGTINWTAAESAAWLNISPTTGDTTIESDNVLASVDITGMSDGDYNTTITITSPEAVNSPKTVNVTLKIAKSGGGGGGGGGGSSGGGGGGGCMQIAVGPITETDFADAFGGAILFGMLIIGVAILRKRTAK